jgi:hypothetical protein
LLKSTWATGTLPPQVAFLLLFPALGLVGVEAIVDLRRAAIG